MLPQIRCLITLIIGSRIFSTNCNITDNIIIYSKKSIGPRMQLWWTLLNIFVETFHSGPSSLLLRKDKIRPNTRPEIPKLKFLEKTSMPNLAQSLRSLKCYSSSSPKPIASPNNSIRYNVRRSVVEGKAGKKLSESHQDWSSEKSL